MMQAQVLQAMGHTQHGSMLRRQVQRVVTRTAQGPSIAIIVEPTLILETGIRQQSRTTDRLAGRRTNMLPAQHSSAFVCSGLLRLFQMGASMLAVRPHHQDIAVFL
jgi:hypothetical protein